MKTQTGFRKRKKKIYYVNTKYKKTSVDILISDRGELKKISRYKEGQLIIIKEKIIQ